MTFTTAEVANGIETFGLQEFVEEVTETWGNNNPSADLPGLGTATYVDGKLGREGGGEDIWFVFKLEDTLYRLTGWYSSYDGSNWEDATPEVVVAKEKIINIYVTEA